VIDALREIPVTGTPPEISEFPRDGCPECKGAVEAEILTCDLGEEHERWRCLDCGEDQLREEDLVTVQAEDVPPDETLDVAKVLKAGRVMPALVSWVKARVKS
jgi:hypothetical protein